MRKIETKDWWPKLVKLKDEMSLKELADQFGVSAAAVRAALKRTDTPRKNRPPGRKRGRSQSHPPEPAPKGQNRRSKSHLIDAYKHLLGVRADSEVAEMAGVSRVTVTNYRSRAGIAAYSRGRPREAKQRERKARPSKIDAFAELLGNVPDRVVAEKAGVTVGAVQHYRVKLGLSAHRHRKTTTRPPLQPTTPGSLPQRTFAWKVTLVAGDVMMVAAESLTAAANRSVTLGEVLALERMGPLM